jgi:hypothetical protein
MLWRSRSSPTPFAMSILPPGQRHSAETALLMSRIERYEQRRQELLAEVARVEQKIAAAKMLLEDSVTEQQQKIVGPLPVVEVPELNPPAVKPKVRSEANFSAIEAMREIVLRLGREGSEGFSVRQVLQDFRNDENLRQIHETYVYHVMKRFLNERLIVKVENARGKYVLAETVVGAPETPSAMVVASQDGFKIVPMTKEERIRQLTRQYLSRRRNKTAHRANIAEFLASDNGPLSEDKSPIKAFAVYVVRWPEFVSDGAGNYTLVEPEKTDRRGDAPPIESSDA